MVEQKSTQKMTNDLSIFCTAHRRVQQGFTYVSDEKQYGEIEYWVMPDDVEGVTGDCEDFALAVRKICDDAGIKTRLVFCTLDGGGHIVLAHEGHISDCNLFVVHRRDQLEKEPDTFGTYKWLSISGYERGEPWQKVKS